jgi:hypothetical protein
MRQRRGTSSETRTWGLLLAVTIGLLAGARPSVAAPTTFRGEGTASATAVLDAFRVAIGGVNNGGNPPPQSGGRREINWDAVKLDGTDFGGNSQVIISGKTVGIPVNRFQGRGVRFEEVYAVSGDGFATANPGVAGQFPAFSPENTFAMFDETDIELRFVLPSDPAATPQPAAVRGFGVIFLDVEKVDSSSIEYFSGTQSLGKFFVNPGPSGQPEFLGVLFDSPVVTRVKITPGEASLFSVSGGTVTPGPSDLTVDAGSNKDMAATDDFVYSEPVPLRGSGRLSISPARLNIRLPRSRAVQTATLKIKNTGRSPLTGFVGELGSAFQVVSGAGPYTLARGQSKTIRVRFSPETGGTFRATLHITSTDPARRSVGVRIIGVRHK